ncbi:hypothetical protein EIP91_012335 [Steccherinum ochraceum]|uniref:FAD/NAD(P)-binding domain-containing protein n=1 Tax=Steccherinum ochraceum TaxID=92696 RepID=A0A4R0RX19_9APHY|nr:hypothetical protein EIP91_012335 [Steccherinum ochraceum]
MELNVWTSTKLTNAARDDKTGKWRATLQNVKTGEERTFEVDHVVFALGLAAGRPYFPTIPGQDQFKGQTLHSMQHKSAKDHLGKKVVIIGPSTSEIKGKQMGVFGKRYSAPPVY